ncbi:MAG: hypothetical protein WCV71_04755 [Patescibacteria group bacterium]
MLTLSNKAKKLKLDYLLLALVMGIFYGWGQWNNYIGDPDGFYHAKIASYINQGQIIKSLPWMQFSQLKNNFTDHQFLYHLILAPFTNIINPLIGVKIATVVLSILMILTFYWLLKRLHIKYAFIFSLGFLILGGLTFRLLLIKTNSLSLIIIWLLIYALIEKKKLLLAILGFIFVWSYGMWPLSFLILISYLIADKIYNYIHVNKTKIFWNKIIHTFNFYKVEKAHTNIKLFLSLLTGSLLGIIINPYWPQNINFYQQLFKIGLSNGQQDFPVGGEWYGTGLGNIISAAPHIFVAMAVIFIILFLNHRHIKKITLLSFLLTFGFLLMTIKSRRYVEYYMPFALLFTATGFNDLQSFINKEKIIGLWYSLSKILKAYLLIMATVFLLLIMPSMYDKLLNVHLSGHYSFNHFKGATQWLNANTPKNSIVFHSDWDEWPILFYQNDHNYYIVGLDAVLMENYNSALHKVYRDINFGEINTNLNTKIKQSFGANYVFIESKSHEKLIKNLNADPHNIIVYQDETSIIYKLK